MTYFLAEFTIIILLRFYLLMNIIDLFAYSSGVCILTDSLTGLWDLHIISKFKV